MADNKRGGGGYIGPVQSWCYRDKKFRDKPHFSFFFTQKYYNSWKLKL